MPTIMKTISICGYAVIATILATTILSLGLLGNAQAQNTTAPQQQQQTANPEQIKTYLTEAIQAIDSANNTQALERVDLAGDQLEMLTGTESVNDDEDEDEGEIEEGPGEDADEAGDVDTNDEEDTP
jgi:type II secretory pathway component PulJ